MSIFGCVQIKESLLRLLGDIYFIVKCLGGRKCRVHPPAHLGAKKHASLFDGRRIPSIHTGMPDIDPHKEEIPRLSLMAEVENGASGTEKLLRLIKPIYSELASIDFRLGSVLETQQRLRAALNWLQPAQLSPGETLPPAEADELNEIYDRIERELAADEARADRLLRLYNL